MICCDPVCYIAAAWMLLILPVGWVLSACTAALVHEICHILVLTCFGGRVRRICVSLRGCVIDAEPMGDLSAVLSILAGPAGSFMLVLFRAVAPQIAVCGLLQGLYNLMPVLPLDGGRVLSLILHRLCPERADRILDWTAAAAGAAVLLAAIYLQICRNTGMMPLMLALVFNIRLRAGKIPCKLPRIKVQ